MSTPKRLVGPQQLAGGASTLYTVPAGKATVVKHLHVFNPSGAPVTFTMSIGADTAGTRVYDAVSIDKGAELDRFCYYPLVAGEVIQAFGGAAATLVMILSGDERAV